MGAISITWCLAFFPRETTNLACQQHVQVIISWIKPWEKKTKKNETTLVAPWVAP